MKTFLLLFLVGSFQLCTAQIEFGPYTNHGYEPYTATIQGSGTIYYTTNGTDPSANSASGVNAVNVTITQNVLLKARLKDSNNQWSGVYSRMYYFGDLPQHTVYFKPPPSWANVCSYMNFIQPQFMIDFWGPGTSMTPACEGWYKSTFGFYEAALAFNNCVYPMIVPVYQEYTTNTEGTVFYDYSAGPITNPPPCLLATDDASKKITVVKVFPNPVQDFITLESDINFLAYEIIDLSGKSLMKKELKEKQIDVSHLNSGVYFIKLISLNRATNIVKFIKK